MVEFGNYEEYGVSTEQACEAIKTIVDPKNGNTKLVQDGLNAIKANANGATPLQYAISYVFSNILEINKTLLPAKILLITDDEPNCLEKYPIKFCHVLDGIIANRVEFEIGIFPYKAETIDPEESELIKCAKKHNTIVKYYPTNNSKDLASKVDDFLIPNNTTALDRIIYIGSSSLIILFLPIIILFRKERSHEKLINIYTLENLDHVEIPKRKVKLESDTNTDQKKALKEAAIAIQTLLEQVDNENPNATGAEKISFINHETTPRFKRSVISALQAGGESAIEEFIDNPYLNVAKAVCKGWLEGWIEPK